MIACGSTIGPLRAIKTSMATKITLLPVLVIAVLLAPMRVPARSCILLNVPSKYGCAPKCCANMACCKTSNKDSGPLVQPLAKGALDLNAVPTAISAIPISQPPVTTALFFPRVAIGPHSPPSLAFICIRLI